MGIGAGDGVRPKGLGLGFPIAPIVLPKGDVPCMALGATTCCCWRGSIFGGVDIVRIAWKGFPADPGTVEIGLVIPPSAETG